MPSQWISWKVGEQRRDMITTVPVRDGTRKAARRFLKYSRGEILNQAVTIKIKRRGRIERA